MDTRLDRFPVRDLGDRYKGQSGQPLQKSAIYDRLNALGLKPEKTTKGSFVNADQLALLDELHQFIQTGGRMADFVVQRKITGQQGKTKMQNGSSFSLDEIAYSLQPTSTTLLRLPDELVELLQGFLEQKPDPLKNRRILNEAFESGFYLATSELLPLLGRKSIPKLDDHNRFSCMGFVFWKSGKIGNQYQWKITKTQS